MNWKYPPRIMFSKHSCWETKNFTRFFYLECKSSSSDREVCFENYKEKECASQAQSQGKFEMKTKNFFTPIAQEIRVNQKLGQMQRFEQVWID